MFWTPLRMLVSMFLFFLACQHFGWLHESGGWPNALLLGVSIMFVVTAQSHFTKRTRQYLVGMVPPALPMPGLVVTATGLLEIIGGLALCFHPPVRQVAAVGLIVLLVAMLPADVYAAQNGITFDGKPPTPLPLRTLIQIVFIAAVALAGFA